MLLITRMLWYLRRHLYSKVAFTILEMLLVIAILGTLAAIVIPVYGEYVDEARKVRAMVEIRTIETLIERYERAHGDLPVSLDVIEELTLEDPWGTPYQYLKIRGSRRGHAQGARKDKFMVPLNTDYDLYSMGKDHDSRPPLSAAKSWDDIIRAADGEYVGVASEF